MLRDKGSSSVSVLLCALVVSYATIMKTNLYNFDPLKPKFYSKTGVYRGIHYFSNLCSETLIVGTRKNHFVEAVLTSTYNLCFQQEYEKYQNFLSENFIFW